MIFTSYKGNVCTTTILTTEPSHLGENPLDHFIEKDATQESLYETLNHNYFSYAHDEDKTHFFEDKHLEHLTHEKLTSPYWQLEHKGGGIFYVTMEALKRGIINYEQFCTAQMQRLISPCIPPTKIAVCNFKLTEKVNFVGNTILKSIFYNFLPSTEFANVFDWMALQPRKEKYAFTLIQNHNPSHKPGISPFVNRMCNVEYKETKFFFIPSFSLLNAIYAVKNKMAVEEASTPKIMLNRPYHDTIFSLKILHDKKVKINAFLPILGTQFNLQNVVINRIEYNPLQYLYYHIEQLLKQLVYPNVLSIFY